MLLKAWLELQQGPCLEEDGDSIGNTLPAEPLKINLESLWARMRDLHSL